jgi:hypothetical protein
MRQFAGDSFYRSRFRQQPNALIGLVSGGSSSATAELLPAGPRRSGTRT